ncbi:MAG: GAF domain-containing protein [Planctomycetes bacterium]|nr:GAF domain-containing protein [Planctomycetota bacterium]
MRLFLDAAWPRLRDCGVSWMGFYEADAPDASATCMLLAEREPKPACSPIGLHGACGSCFKTGKTLVVRDVAELGKDYIACDPRDRSELVVPCLEAGGRPWGVLDLDSFEVGSFNEGDARIVETLLELAHLTVKS